MCAQEYKQYSEITIKPERKITSSNVKLDQVDSFFSVVEAPDKDLIGCPVIGNVIEVRKSNISGSEGRLRIRPLFIIKRKEKISVCSDIFVRGYNISNVKFWLCFLPPVIFVPGTGAKIYTTDRFAIHLR